MQRVSYLRRGGLVALGLTLVAAAPWSKPKEVEEQRQEIREIHDSTLARLYAAQPSARRAVETAVGYAVFSNFGMKILVAGGGSGKGMAIDNATAKVTYMKMVEIQAGLGMGIKKFQLVWVFETPEAFRQFVDTGWTFGAQASAAAQKGDEGMSYTGALAVAPGVWLYQLVEDGLALELTAKGTKYFQDDELN